MSKEERACLGLAIEWLAGLQGEKTWGRGFHPPELFGAALELLEDLYEDERSDG